MGVTAAIVVGVTSVGSTAYSIREQRKAQKSNERAARLEQKRVEAENARNARRAAAQAQIQRSRIQAAQAAAPGVGSSGTTNQVGAISAQLGSELGFQSFLSRNQSSIIGLQNKASQSMGRASTAQAIGSLPGSLGFGAGDILRSRNS